MASKVEIEWASNDAAVARTLQKTEAGLDALARKMDRVEASSRKATQTAKGGLADAGKEALAFTSAFTGVGSATAGILAIAHQVRQEYDALLARQRESMMAQRGAGEALREVRKVFAPDPTMNAAQMERRLGDIAVKHGSNIATVSSAATTAFSAKGQLSNEAAASAIEAAVRMAPTNAGEAATLSGRYQDVMKATGQTDARAVAGWLTAVQQGSRIATMSGVGQNAVPAINALVATGDSAEQAAEVFNTINQLMADQEGSLSRTATINLASQLQKAFPQLKGTQARIAAVQGDAGVREKFLKGASFDAASKNFITALLSGEAAAVGAYGAAQRSVPALNAAQAAEFERQMAFINGGDFQPVVGVGQRGQAALERLRLRDRIGGLQGAAREEYDRAIAAVNLPGPDWAAKKWRALNIWGESTIDQRNPIATMEDDLNRLAARQGIPAAEAQYLRETAAEMKQLRLSVEQMMRQLAKDGDKPQKVEVVNQPREPLRQEPVPSQALDRRGATAGIR